MSGNIQCPRCDGYNTEKQLEETKGCVGIIAALLWLPAFPFLCSFFSQFTNPSIGWGEKIANLLAGSFFLGLGIISMFIFGKDPALMKCNICGYKWRNRDY